MIKRLGNYIENEPWERYIDVADRWIVRVAWVVIGAAVVDVAWMMLRYVFS